MATRGCNPNSTFYCAPGSSASWGIPSSPPSRTTPAPMMRLPRINTRYPRLLIGGVLFGTYYALSTWQIYQKDQFDAILEMQDRRHQDYLMSDQGKADQLAASRAEEEERRQMKAWEDEENAKLAQTPEGRATLEKNRKILISDLRYRETKLQYLLARQVPDLKKAQTAVREKIYNESVRKQLATSS